MDRPKISIYIACSIDGYIARTDGNIDWLNYGHSGDEDYGFYSFLDSIDATIMGRGTYEVASTVEDWPYKGKRVIVLSNTLTSVRSDAELFSGELTDLVTKLHDEKIQHIWVDGGKTVSQFLEKGLVDEMTLSIIAMILGDGIPLFSKINREYPCKLISTKPCPSGLVQLKYLLSE